MCDHIVIVESFYLKNEEKNEDDMRLFLNINSGELFSILAGHRHNICMETRLEETFWIKIHENQSSGIVVVVLYRKT